MWQTSWKKPRSLLTTWLYQWGISYHVQQFFITKIAKIREVLESACMDTIPAGDCCTCIPPKLATFKVLTYQDVEKIISRSTSTSCEVDPIPTSLLKEALPLLIEILTAIVNLSMQSSVFPESLMEALVKPLLKKITLELTDKNYRPVLKLQFTGKLIEHAVTNQLNEHITQNNLREPVQLAYRSGHSTETAFLKVCNDMLRTLDTQEVMCLVLLDLPTAFNTVNHWILLRHLESNFGITDTALAWIRSNLSDHSQNVVIGKAESDPITLIFGVPQGSMLGLILFTLYTSPLGQICNRHGITYHIYTDDQQIYMAFKPSKKGDQKDCVRRLENCIGEIRMWMSTNMWKLNDEKIEFTIFCRQWLAKVQQITIMIGDIRIKPVEYVRNLGFFMDNQLKNHIPINKLTSSLYYNLWNIHKIRGKLDFELAKTFTQALILSKVVYCNSLLLATTLYQLDKLQYTKTWHVKWFSNFWSMTGSLNQCPPFIGYAYMKESSTR